MNPERMMASLRDRRMEEHRDGQAQSFLRILRIFRGTEVEATFGGWKSLRQPRVRRDNYGGICTMDRDSFYLKINDL